MSRLWEDQYDPETKQGTTQWRPYESLIKQVHIPGHVNCFLRLWLRAKCWITDGVIVNRCTVTKRFSKHCEKVSERPTALIWWVEDQCVVSGKEYTEGKSNSTVRFLHYNLITASVSLFNSHISYLLLQCVFWGFFCQHWLFVHFQKSTEYLNYSGCFCQHDSALYSTQPQRTL